MESGELDSLVRRALKRQVSAVCWAAQLPPRAAAMVESLYVLERENPGLVNRAEVRRILRDESEFDPPIEVSREAVGRHFRGDCACGKEED